VIRHELGLGRSRQVPEDASARRPAPAQSAPSSNAALRFRFPPRSAGGRERTD
jgi:hypothetical protein